MASASPRTWSPVRTSHVACGALGVWCASRLSESTSIPVSASAWALVCKFHRCLLSALRYAAPVSRAHVNAREVAAAKRSRRRIGQLSTRQPTPPSCHRWQ